MTRIGKRCAWTARSYAPTSTRLAPQKRRPARARALARRAEHKDSSHGRCAGQSVALDRDGRRVADIPQAHALSEGLNPQAVIGAKGYDADALVARIHAAGAAAVIPARSHRIDPRDYDRPLYQDRNLMEPFLNRLKPVRRMATRYDTLVRTFVSLLNRVCAYIWLA
jgi:transposase